MSSEHLASDNLCRRSADGGNRRRLRFRAAVCGFIGCAMLASILWLGPTLVSAGHVQIADPSDTRGLLDVRQVRMVGDHSAGSTWRIATYRRWKAEDVWDKGQALVLLDTLGGREIDYYAVISTDGARFRALLWRVRQGRRDRKVGKLRVWRRDPRSVSVAVVLDERLAKRRAFYRWRIQTLWNGRKCPRVCFDFSPNRGWVREVVSGRPSPTPTRSPSPIPTQTASPTPDPLPTLTIPPQLGVHEN